MGHLLPQLQPPRRREIEVFKFKASRIAESDYSLRLGRRSGASAPNA